MHLALSKKLSHGPASESFDSAHIYMFYSLFSYLCFSRCYICSCIHWWWWCGSGRSRNITHNSTPAVLGVSVAQKCRHLKRVNDHFTAAINRSLCKRKTVKQQWSCSALVFLFASFVRFVSFSLLFCALPNSTGPQLNRTRFMTFILRPNHSSLPSGRSILIRKFRVKSFSARLNE